jgi:HPt (histidine-containing phosphotransfer) domain-containing protein
MMSEEVSDSLSAVIDWNVLDALKFLNKPGKPDLRVDLMRMFLTTVPPQMADLKEAAAVGDAEKVMRVAHSMKSSSLNVGAVVFGKTCHEIEQLGRSNSLADIQGMIDRGEQELQASSAVFRQVLIKGFRRD